MNTMQWGLKGLVLGMLALVGLGLSHEAKAQVSVMPCVITGSVTYIHSYGCASEYTVNAQYQYLSTGVNASVMGATGTSEGVIELLRKLNDEQTKSNEGDRQTMPNDDLASRARETDMAQRNAIERYTRPISAEACREGTIGRGLGGAGGGSSRAAADASEIKNQEEVLTPQKEDTYLGDLTFSPTTKNYCMDADVANKMPQCKAVGSLPGANTNPSTLVMGATQSNTERNYSIVWEKGNPQYEAVVDYMRMMRPFPGPTINENSKETPQGRRYLILQRRYNTKVVAVLNVLSNISNESAALPANSYMVQQVWNNDDVKADFKEIYPSAKYPDRPSEREIMRLMVLRQFGSTMTAQDMATSSPEDLARRQIELMKMNNYLLLKQKEQQEWTNILLAHILSNEVDPVTRDKLVNASSQASQAR